MKVIQKEEFLSDGTPVYNIYITSDNGDEILQLNCRNEKASMTLLRSLNSDTVNFS